MTESMSLSKWSETLKNAKEALSLLEPKYTELSIYRNQRTGKYVFTPFRMPSSGWTCVKIVRRGEL